MMRALGLRRCTAKVALLFPAGAQRVCSNPAVRRAGRDLLCDKHLRRKRTVNVTLEFEMDALGGVEAARLALAVKRAVDRQFEGTSGGPIVDDEGVVLGHWRIK